jgi:prephenate dehydrogenase
MNKICIIGVGLIGGSFALGLKQLQQVKCIMGYSRNESNLKEAQALGVIDTYSLDIKTALNEADLVLIATPVDSFKAILTLIKPHLTPQMIVSDVGSTKQSVADMAKHVFGKVPEKFILAHPIAGKETSGVAAATADLFQEKKTILTPLVDTDSKALKKVRQLWQNLGAEVVLMSCERHDELLAMTSHLPHILAFSLMAHLHKQNPDALNYAAGGFKDFSRIASSDAQMWVDICLNNTQKITHQIECYQEILAKLSLLINAQNKTELNAIFEKAKHTRDKFYE